MLDNLHDRQEPSDQWLRFRRHPPLSLPSRQRQGGCSRKRQGDLVECTVTDLSVRGEGVGRFGQRVVFVPDTLPGDRVLVRLVRVKR